MFNSLADETCPTGYTAVSETDVYVSSSDSCPSGHSQVQTVSLENCINVLATGAKTCTYFAVECQTGYSNVNGICTENTININWNQGYDDKTMSSTCSYDGEITMPEDPVRPGYTFTGWQLIE